MPFSLDRDNAVGIYGYTKRGLELEKFLKNSDFQDIFFIDQNQQQCENVYSFDELFDNEKKRDEDIMIFISLQNAITHSAIAEKFYAAGVDKIIFLPADITNNTNNAGVMRQIYNDLIGKSLDHINNIPLYSEIINKFELKSENAIIYQDKNRTVFWAPLNNIFVNNERKNIVEINKEYYGKCIASVDHYQAVFNYFENGENNPSLKKYMTAQGYVNDEGDYIFEKLKDRYRLWCLYKAEFNAGMDFFISSAPEMSVNENGGLNIRDGLHRIIFLYMQKLSYAPVTLNTDVFNKIYNNSELDNIREFMTGNKITKVKTPIEHPAFYRFACEKENREPSVLTCIQRYLGTINIEEYDILDISDYNSYFARNMSRMRTKSGNGHICAIETTLSEYLFAGHLNKLLKVKNIELELIGSLKEIASRKYDWVFALGKFQDSKKLDYQIPVLDKMTKQILFWESDFEIAQMKAEEILNKTSFQKFRLLYQYFDGIKTKMIIVFEK